MKISDIMTTNSVFVGIKVSSKRELLQEVAEKASQIAGLDCRTVFDALLERENLGSTGFGGGTALPHGRFADLNQVHGIFVKTASPIDFDAIDGKPVDLVFVLLSPEGSGADHLTALAKVSRVLKDESLCSKLRQISSTEEIYALLNGED